MRQLIAVTPTDIEESITPMEQFVVQMAVAKINSELMRQHYKGPEPFEVYIADHLTSGAIREIVTPFKVHWHNPRVVQRDSPGMQSQYWFILETFTTPKD